VAGKGNNGGDGYVIARHLANFGWQVSVLVLAERSNISGDAEVNLRILENSNNNISYASTAAEIATVFQNHSDALLVVDAIFGNGLNTPVRGHYLAAIEQINASQLPVVAVDMPSGVDATTGEILGTAINADCSISFAVAKLGQVSYPASRCCGELFVVDIGMPKPLQDSIPSQYILVDEQCACALLPERPVEGHKGTFGHVLVVAGSLGKSGAAQLCALACARSGSGLVTLATPQVCQAIVASAVAEVMTYALDDCAGGLSATAVGQLAPLWQGKQAIAVGPGLGQTDSVREVVAQLVENCPVPLVIDADALNVLSGSVDLLPAREPDSVVLTPHPGEMSRLTGLSVEYIQNHRCEVARQFAQQWRVVLVLKGARTVVAAPDGRICINSSGNSGMGSGGMGDVLTGIIAAWIAQGLDLFSAAVLGVYLHGAAADHCAQQLGTSGYLAGDLAQRLPTARQILIKRR
jgi:NAD(P)H-hydrate epimerase